MSALLDSNGEILLDSDGEALEESGTLVIGAMVLAQPEVITPNQPLLGWRNFVSETDFTASSETEFSPVSNLANPSTAFGWEATSTDDQQIDIENERPVDYLGIARHNLRGGAEMRIEFGVGGSFSVVINWFEVPTRQAIMFLFNEAQPDTVRIRIRDNAEPPAIAVAYLGRVTELQRRIYVGHTPVTMGRTVETVGGYSENGQYLGEVTRREGRQTSVNLQNLTPSWYRSNLDPFLAQRPRRPAFFAWRPESYPTEVGYVWLRGNPQPSNQRANGMMQIDMDFEAIT